MPKRVPRTQPGIDPQAIVLNAIGNIVYSVCADPAVRFLFNILPTILLLISILGAYKKGRSFGLISVIVAYLAGVFFFVSAATVLTLLGIAICTGYLAAGRRLTKKLVGI